MVDDTDGTVYCGDASARLSGDLVGDLVVDVSVEPARLRPGESIRARIERYRAHELLDIPGEPKPLPGFDSRAWEFRKVELPERATIRVYAFEGPYMVRVSVHVYLVEKGTDKVEQRCLDITTVLVRESIDILSG